MKISWTREPILLLAPARSCTSVVTAMLGQHPELYAFPELNLFRSERVGELFEREKTDITPHQLSGLLRGLAQVHSGSQDNEAVQAARSWLRERSEASCVEVMNHLLESVSPRIAIDKSPSTLLEEGAIERALAAYPGARLIHLARHPVTTASSMYVHWGKVLRGPAPSHADCVLMWCMLHRKALLLLAEIERQAPGRTIRIRAEDALNSPGRTLGQVFGWLGVGVDDAAIDAALHPERSPYVGHGPHSAPWGAAEEFLTDPARRAAELPENIAFPDDWRLPSELTQAVAQIADRLGYAAESPPSEDSN